MKYDDQAMSDDTKRLREAAREYVAGPPVVTMSSKRQITLPADIVRRLGLKPGAKLSVYVGDGIIRLVHRPGTWVEYITSRPPMYKTREEVDARIREAREGWDERARRFEGDSYSDADA